MAPWAGKSVSGHQQYSFGGQEPPKAQSPSSWLVWPSVPQSLHIVLSLNVFSCVSMFLLLIGQDGGLAMLLWLLSDSRALATLLPLSGFVYRHLPLHPAQILPLDKDNIQVHPQLSQSHLCPTKTRASHPSLGGAGSTSGDVRMLVGGSSRSQGQSGFL